MATDAPTHGGWWLKWLNNDESDPKWLGVHNQWVDSLPALLESLAYPVMEHVSISRVDHTPGPWRVVPNPMRSDGFFVVRERRADEHEAYPNQLPPAITKIQVSPADAYLIAAAPEMRAALKAVVADVDVEQGADVRDEVMALVRAALAKSEPPQ